MTTIADRGALRLPRLRAWVRAGRASGRLLDAVVVAVVLLLSSAEFALGQENFALDDAFTPVVLAVGLLLPQPLWWRRTHPVLCMAGSLVLGAAYYLSLTEPARQTVAGPWASAGAAAWAAAGWGRRRDRLAALSLAVVGSVIFGALAGPQEGVGAAVVMAVCAALGTRAARQRAREELLREEAASERRRVHREVRAALEDERLRIARDLHDGIAHHVTVMTMHASATRRRLARDHEPAAGDVGMDAVGIDAVEEAGRRALADLRSLVSAMRTPRRDDADHPADAGSTCDLVAVPALVHAVRSTGMSIELRQNGEPVPLTSRARVTAYRVVQEGLSNCLRHAGQVPVEVVLDWSADGLRLLVEDGGPDGLRPPGDEPGYGLIGLRERVTADGGTLTSGRTPGGGFRLRAWLPAELQT